MIITLTRRHTLAHTHSHTQTHTHNTHTHTHKHTQTHTHSLRELKHKNICPFYGCLFAGVKSALLYKYFSRGTLEHLLLNSEIDFQCVFRMSFALDVARGMEYLHSKRIIHGRLETRACVVDENWVVKLRGEYVCVCVCVCVCE